MDELATVIEFYEELCKTRPGHAFWAENLIEASQKIKTHINHANFYKYLSNPDSFQYEKNIKTLADFTDKELEQIDKELCELSVKDQKTTIYQNGTEQVHIIENEDEKCDS